MAEHETHRDTKSMGPHQLSDDIIMDEEYEVDEEDIGVELDELDYIEEWCPQCKDSRPHAKARENDQTVLICAECNERHVVRSTVKSKAKTAKLILAPEDYENEKVYKEVWKKYTSDLDQSTAARYSLSLKPSVPSLVEHPRFGLGVVCLFTDNKAEILFEDGVRRLVCGR